MKIGKDGKYVDVDVLLGKDNKWCGVDLYIGRDTTWVPLHMGEEYDNFELTAYTSWYDDPSDSVMLHYILKKDVDIDCLYRKEGTESWNTLPLYKNMPFPKTTNRVNWYKLEGLEPDTIYETKLDNHKQVHRFKTMPSSFDRDIKVAMVSDQANDETDFANDLPFAFNLIHGNNTDVIVMAGDAVHDDGQRSRVWPIWWEKYTEIEKQNNMMKPVIVSFGNHDGRQEDDEGNFISLLWTWLGATKDDVLFHYNFFSNLNDEGYGAIDINNYFSFIFLNSNHTANVVGQQTTWLDNALTSRENRTIFPFFHVPPYPAWYDYNAHYTKQLRDTWTPIFTSHNIKVVGNGHEHAHVVTKKVTGDSLDPNGVVYMGQGRSPGNVTRGLNVDSNTWFVDYVNNEHKGVDFVTFKQNGDVKIDKISLDGNSLYSKTL